MKITTILWVFLACLVVAGCSSTTVTDREPIADVPLEEALNTISRLTMTQHPAWRPDGIGITEEFLHWGFGTTTRGTVGGMAIGVFGVANSRSTTRSVGDRLYFNDVVDIELLDWKRKGKQWYVVSVLKRHDLRTHILRSRYREDAIAYMDALASVMVAYQSGELQAFIEEREAAE